MPSLLQDIRYAVRSLIKRPGFVTIAVVTLAFGIGANTAIFTVVNSVLLRPLSYHESDRIVVFIGTNLSKGINDSNMSVPDFNDWHQQSQSFENMAGFVSGNIFLGSNDETERIRGAAVSDEFFPLFRAGVLKGRLFQQDDFKQGASPVALLGYALWQRRFGGSDSVIGSKVTVSGRSTTIVGVMPPQFDYPDRSEAWAPFPINPANEQRYNRNINVITRLKPGVSVQQAQTEMSAISERLAQSYTETNAGWNVKLNTLQDLLVGELRAPLWILLAAVGLVLLIACSNVANLQLARATFRQKEIAVRTALGASRLRIIRQLLTESVLLSLVSGVAGIALSIWLTKLLIAISPPDTPRFEEIGLDAKVFVFAFAIALLTGIVFGLVPALRTSRTDLNETLKESGRSGLHARRNRTGGALMVTEIGLSFMLLVGAGLLIKSFIRLREVNPGFNPDNAMTMRISMPGPKYTNGESRAQAYKQLLDRIQIVPGVSSAGAILSLPLGGDTLNVGRGYLREGDTPTPDKAGNAMYFVVTPGYFSTLQIPLKSGRTFTDYDTDQTPKVIIVNETMARKLWPGQSPIGRKISVWRDEKFFREIVGIVGDTRAALDTESSEQMYVPYAQDANWGGMSLIVRSNTEPGPLVAAVRNEIRAFDKSIPIYNVRTVGDLVDTAAASRRTPMLLLTSFAGVAMLLAMLGIYGVTAYYVTQRTHEIGVRIALGARLKDILRLVLVRGLLLAIVGIGIGVLGAFALTRYLKTLLFNVPPIDSVTFVIVAAVLVFVALLACLIPARRASKVDPLVALRYE